MKRRRESGPDRATSLRLAQANAQGGPAIPGKTGACSVKLEPKAAFEHCLFREIRSFRTIEHIVNTKNKGKAGWPLLAPSRLKSPASAPKAAVYLVCLGMLVPCLGFAAYLMSSARSQELTLLQAAARSRAMLAASCVDDQMGKLLGTLKALPSASSESPGSTEDRIRDELSKNGIQLFTRGENLDLLTPVGGLDTTMLNLDGAARSAAEAALSTLAPQITRYGQDADKGIDVWIAAESARSGPVLLQAKIPSSYFTATLRSFASGGPWTIAVLGSDGQVLARTRAKAGNAPHLGEVKRASIVEAMADTAQFGWKVAARIPENAFEQGATRNWITFLTLSSLLAATSLAGATWLTRNISHGSNATRSTFIPGPQGREPDQRAGMSLPLDRPGKKSGSREQKSREQRLRQILRAGNVGVWEWDLRTGNVHWDAEISDLFDDLGPASDHPARLLMRRVDRYDRRRLLKAISAAISHGKPLALEIRARRPDGDVRWIAVRGAQIESDGNEASVVAGVAYDVTDQKLSLTRTDALLREVSHRSKNLLALILAMARLTARDAVDVKSHLKDFTLRVAGLAASQDLIVASDWQSVDLATLAAAEIGAVARTDADRVAIVGPPVMLTPEAAQTLGMVLTELALNAVEHGGLSSATGEVLLEWSLPDAGTILICWREKGGAPFLADSPKGYGMSVVERFSTQGLKLSANAQAKDDEFTWTLTGPLVNIGHPRKIGTEA